MHIFTITVITIEFGVVRVCAFCVLQEILQKQSVPLRKKSKLLLIYQSIRCKKFVVCKGVLTSSRNKAEKASSFTSFSTIKEETTIHLYIHASKEN